MCVHVVCHQYMWNQLMKKITALEYIGVTNGSHANEGTYMMCMYVCLCACEYMWNQLMKITAFKIHRGIMPMRICVCVCVCVYIPSSDDGEAVLVDSIAPEGTQWPVHQLLLI